jgi:hypothetical protein
VRENAAKGFLIPLRHVFNRELSLFAYELGQPGSNLADGQDQICHPAGYGAARHRGVLGLIGILNQNEAPAFLHGLHAQGAVRACTGENDGEAVAMLVRHGSEKLIDGSALAARLVERRG